MVNNGLVQKVTVSTEDGVSIVTTESGELLQIIQQNPDSIAIVDELQQSAVLDSVAVVTKSEIV